MSNGHGLTGENLLRTLPPALARDETMRALAAAIAGLLAAQPDEMEKLAVFPNIDRLDGPLLDILAQDFKVDWWDSDYNDAEKRRTLSASWQVHKTLGTRAAVEKAASAVYPNTRVQEWFEYGGEPYRFKLDVGLGEFEWDRERHKRLMWGLNFYKNLRSHLEAVEYHVPPVEVENRQAFYLAALLIRLWVREGYRLARSRLLLRYQARTEAGAALSALRLGAHIAQKEKLALASLLARAWEENRQGFSLSGAAFRAVQANEQGLTARELVMLSRQEQGQGFTVGGFYRAREPNFQGLGAKRLSLNTGIAAQETVGASVTQSNTDWRFNSKHKFNGMKKFNGGIKRSEL